MHKENNCEKYIKQVNKKEKKRKNLFNMDKIMHGKTKKTEKTRRYYWQKYS